MLIGKHFYVQKQLYVSDNDSFTDGSGSFVSKDGHQSKLIESQFLDTLLLNNFRTAIKFVRGWMEFGL